MLSLSESLKLDLVDGPDFKAHWGSEAMAQYLCYRLLSPEIGIQPWLGLGVCDCVRPVGAVGTVAITSGWPNTSGIKFLKTRYIESPCAASHRRSQRMFVVAKTRSLKWIPQAPVQSFIAHEDSRQEEKLFIILGGHHVHGASPDGFENMVLVALTGSPLTFHGHRPLIPLRQSRHHISPYLSKFHACDIR